MPAVSIATIGLGLAAVGTGVGVVGSVQQANASKEAEEVRRRQMLADASQKRRQAIREGMQARAMAMTNTTAGGASEGSAQGGAVAAISSNVGQRVGDVNASQNFGEQMFSAQNDISQGRMVSSIGSAIGQLGNTMISQSEAAGRIVQRGTEEGFYGRRLWGNDRWLG